MPFPKYCDTTVHQNGIRRGCGEVKEIRFMMFKDMSNP
jgi:hypothetical protein